MAEFAGVRKALAGYLTRPVVRLLVGMGITPNIITWLGFLLAVSAAAMIYAGWLVAGGVVVVVAGFLDIVDGALARSTNQVTRFGAILDSTLDRLSEGVLLLGIAGLFLSTGEQPLLFTTLAEEWAVLLVFVTLVGSVLVSYVRARAEAQGLDCKVGIFTRGERVVALVLGLWLNQLVIAMAVIAAFSFITAGQRLVYVWRHR